MTETTLSPASLMSFSNFTRRTEDLVQSNIYIYICKAIYIYIYIYIYSNFNRNKDIFYCFLMN